MLFEIGLTYVLAYNLRGKLKTLLKKCLVSSTTSIARAGK